MGVLLSTRNLAKRYGPRPLFENLTFGLFDNERTGLIGPNGTGKSTLLKILAGQETADSGELSVRRGLKVKYLAQRDSFEAANEGGTVRDELVHALKDSGLEDYEIDIRIETALEGSGFAPDQLLSTLSGGWRKRLAILSQVITEPDLLLLDEPTNHLDVAGVLWLETFLSGLTFPFLVITHDRRFLETVCSRIIELNKRYENGHFSSSGNYSQFIENREAHLNMQSAREDSLRNTVRREVEWLRRGPKARTTKQKARIDRAGDLMGELSELQFRNAQDRSATIDFSGSQRQTKKLVDAHHIQKSMGGRKLFGPLDVMLGPGDKLGLLGGNGSGKSTFLKLLAGALEPDAGTLKRAPGLKIITFDQHREQLDLNLSLRQALCESGEHVHYKGSAIHITSWAERFLFNKEQLHVPLKQLSGGEQSRVLIARLMLRQADLLLLDEPTNDLDINSLEVLENSMLEFPGALVLVTHDRYLLDRVSQRLLAFDGKGHARFYADLAQWEDHQIETPETPPAPSPTKAPEPATKKGLTAKEEKELKNIEANIRAAEAERKAADSALSDVSIASNPAELLARQQTLDAVKKKLDTLFEQWEHIESRRS